jgi:murein DD-endopeptidase MepM/ murein hydrolase activator NlpD
MDTDSGPTSGKQNGAYTTQFHTKPFLTILDGKPASRVRAMRKSSFRNPTSTIRKNKTKVQSYVGEGAQAIATGCRKCIGAAAMTLWKIPGTIFTSASDKAAQPVETESRGKMETKDEAGTGSDDRNTFSYFEAVKGFAVSIASFHPVSRRAPRIMLFVLITAIAISAGAAVIIGAKNFPVTPDNFVLPDEESAQSALMAYLEPEFGGKENLPSGTLPPIPLSVSLKSYTIRNGDSLEKIAKRFGLRQDTIISANSLQSANSIRPGVQLRIPNMDGVSHKVRKGENLSSLAKSYAIDITRIVDANDLASGTISTGQSLFIPNAKLSSASLRGFYGERFIWPARGRISSSFGYRANPFTGLKTYHSAIDIVISPGTKVKSTNEGSVADTGYNSVFGNYIILKHASGYQSLYAHLSNISVKEGSSVGQGTTIGLSGNTGQSTGPHLHFSIFKNGQALDPAKYVK